MGDTYTFRRYWSTRALCTKGGKLTPVLLHSQAPLGPGSSEAPLLSASTGMAGMPAGVWDADVAFSRVKIYLMGNPFADLDFTMSQHVDPSPKVTLLILGVPPASLFRAVCLATVPTSHHVSTVIVCGVYHMGIAFAIKD